MSRVAAVFAGGVRPLPPEGQPSGIVKHAVAGPVALGFEGLAGDAQADRKVHGGPDKALHHYPAEHYAAWAAAYPQCAAQFVPGSLGENVSTTGWTEENVCVGDVFRIGAARVQVTQPRSPCWKINHRYGLENALQFVAERGLTGWYCRVLEPASIAAGDAFELIGRNADPVTLKRLWQVTRSHRPAAEELSRLGWTPGLSESWAEKLRGRLEWLRQNG
ncbi:MAG: MOSC domain-containing protein [Betaproteobacteria bacterium]|nr:MOSC domain-containing protein [Betaproteobacteria bacterium]